MKKVFVLFFGLLYFALSANAVEEAELIKENTIQTRINTVGTKILNSNKLQKRVVFVYDKENKKGLLKNTKSLT